MITRTQRNIFKLLKKKNPKYLIYTDVQERNAENPQQLID